MDERRRRRVSAVSRQMSSWRIHTGRTEQIPAPRVIRPGPICVAARWRHRKGAVFWRGRVLAAGANYRSARVWALRADLAAARCCAGMRVGNVSRRCLRHEALLRAGDRRARLREQHEAQAGRDCHRHRRRAAGRSTPWPRESRYFGCFTTPAPVALPALKKACGARRLYCLTHAGPVACATSVLCMLQAGRRPGRGWIRHQTPISTVTQQPRRRRCGTECDWLYLEMCSPPRD